MDPKPNERFVEVLEALDRFRAAHEPDPRFPLYAAPTAVGAFEDSHHELTLDDLTARGLVDDGASFFTKGDGRVGRYRITIEGRKWLHENAIRKPRGS